MVSGGPLKEYEQKRALRYREHVQYVLTTLASNF